MLTVELRDDAAVFTELREWWNAQPGPQTTPFLRSEWFECWSRTRLAEGERLYVLVARMNSQPAAAIALARKGRWVRSLTDGASEVFDVIHGANREAVEAIIGHLRREPRIVLDRLDGTSPLLDATADGTGWGVERRVNSPFVDLSQGADAVWSELSSKRRKSIRKSRQVLEDMGALEMGWSVADECVAETLEEAFELEARGWKGQVGVDMLSNPEKRDFFTRFGNVAMKEQWLRISTMKIDGRLVAFQYDLEFNGNMYGILKSYDESLPKRSSPGTVLFKKAMSEAAERGMARYYMGGDDTSDWKAAWMSDSVPRVDISGFGSTMVGRLWRQASNVRRYLKTR